jgi:hypothetical protein
VDFSATTGNRPTNFSGSGRSWPELAAEALDRAALTDDLVPVIIDPGRRREGLMPTPVR